MGQAYGGVHSALGYPNQFIFQVGPGNVRAASVIWAEHSSQEDTFQRGREKAEADARRKVEQGKTLSPDQIPTYQGFLAAKVANIRGVGAAELSDDDSEEFCTPGVFDVAHAPEEDFFSHTHIELREGYLDALKAQMARDGKVAASGELTDKKAKIAVAQMLINVFEHGGIIQPADATVHLS